VAELHRLRPLAEAKPTTYRRRVWFWAVLGYAFIIALLIGSVGLMSLVLAFGLFTKAFVLLFKVAAVLGIFAWKVVRSLWVKFEAPKGLPLTSANAGPLLAVLQEQTQALQAPPVHRVVLSNQFNAAVVQVPRLGIMGWSRNYVIVGLPLLQALSPDQAAAVMAHELGHLRGGHSRFSSWIYRVNQTWAQLMAQLERQQGRSWFSRFAAWYVPRFDAWSHPIRRTDEFAADAAAAELTDPRTMAEALCATVVRDAAIDKLYWDTLTATIADRPLPPPDAITQLLPVAKTIRLADAEEQRLLAQAYEADPDPFSTHPTLGERLAALGQAPVVPPLPATTAADVWLGASLPQLAAALDANWAEAHTELWKERHQTLQQQRQRLQTLTARHTAGETLSADESWELADLTEDHIGGVEALPLFKALLDDPQWGTAARFSVGRVLINLDDESGLPWLTEVMEQEPSYVTAGLALQEAFHQRQGNRDQVRQLGTAQLRHADTLDEAMAERNVLLPTDQLVPHELTEAAVQELITQVSSPDYGIGKAWLLRKQVRHFAHKPLYILLVAPRPEKRLRTEEAIRAWVQELATKLTLPGEGFIIAASKEHEWLKKAAIRMPDAEFFVG